MMHSCPAHTMCTGHGAVFNLQIINLYFISTIQTKRNARHFCLLTFRSLVFTAHWCLVSLLYSVYSIQWFTARALANSRP